MLLLHKMPNEGKRASEFMHVLFLYASTGSGHLKAAEYIEEALYELDSDIKISMTDVLNMCNFPIESLVLKMFRMLISQLPNLYRFFYRLSENNALFNRIAGIFFKDSIENLQKRCIDEKITHIVCTHPLALLFVSKLKEQREDTSVVTMGIITDYQIHRFWLYPRIDYYCVPNVEMKEELLQMGWSDGNVRVTGIPCPSSTMSEDVCDNNNDSTAGLTCPSSAMYKDACENNNDRVAKTPLPSSPIYGQACKGNYQNSAGKFEKGLDIERPFCLVSGGGWGLSNLEETTYSMLKKILNCNLLVVTGKNKSLLKRLKVLEKKNSDRLTVKGTIPNMFNTMKNALVVLTKPGGLTVTEAMILNKPLILLKPLPGAEERNYNYLVKKGAAISFNSFVEHPDIVFKWQELFSEKQSQTANKKSSQAIATWIIETYSSCQNLI